MGSSHIKGVVSALEYHRFNNQHLYPHISETQIPLRNDGRIKAFEKAAQSNEPNRADKAHILKAAGSSAGRICLVICNSFTVCSFYCLDTYTEVELINCSLYCLKPTSTGLQTVFISIRDRACLLLSSQTAFRGDSARSLLWSDLFLTQLPIHDIAPGTVVPVGVLCHL